MRKSQFLLIVLGLLQLNVMSQGTGSLEQYYIGSGNAYTMAPIGSYQFNSGFYLEGRYNYEDLNTLSFYFGKTIEREGNFSFSLTPMAGLVLGFYKGGSVGANISFDYKRFSFFSSPQYTFSMQDRSSNFGYNWTDLSVGVSKWLSLGVSAQITQLYQDKLTVEKGFMLEPSYRKWAFPLYIYNPANSANRYFVLGLSFEWEMNRKKSRKSPATVPLAAPAIPMLPKKVVSSTPAKSKEVKHVSVAMITLNGTNKAENNTTSTSSPISGRTASATKGPASSNQEFAIAVGPFKNRDEAVSTQSRMKSKLGNVRITAGQRQFWITGFGSEKEAVSFTAENTFKEFKAPFAVVSYKVKRVEVTTIRE